MPGAAAGIIAAAIPAVTSLASGLASSGGTSAASSQSQALNAQAIQTAKDNMGADRANAQPYVSTGQNALTQYGNIVGLNGADAASSAMSSFTSSPGYGYQVQQGLKAVDNGAAATGMLRSGATLKAEQTLGNNLAGQDFTAYMGRLNSLAGLGLQGAALDNQSTSTFNSLLSGRTSDDTSVITGAAAKNASIYGSIGSGLTNAAGLANKNGLFDSLGSSGPKSGDGYNGTALYVGQGT